MDSRKPLARVSSEKYRPHTVKFPDSLWAEFTEQALAEGQQNISTYVRDCALIGKDYRKRDLLLGVSRGMTGITARTAGNTTGRTAG